MKQVILIIIFLVPVVKPSNAQWNLLNTTLNCSALDFVNDSIGLCTSNDGQGGYILKTSNYGVAWDTVYICSPLYILKDVVFASEEVAYACGQPDLLLKSVDGGITWYDPSEGEDAFYSDLFFVNDTLGYAAGGDGSGRLATTYDGGISWTIMEEGGARDIHCNTACNCFAAIGSLIFNTTTCGNEWPCDTLTQTNRTVNTIWAFSSDHYFIGSLGGFGTSYNFNFGSIQKTTDGGASFYTLDFPYVQYVIDLFFVDELTGYAGCKPFYNQPYTVLKTEDGGNTWGRQDVELNPLIDYYASFQEIDCPSPQYCYGAGSGIYRTTNGGGEIHEAWAEVSKLEIYHPQPTTLTLFPNPTSSSFRIEATRPQEVRSIEIYNATGQLMAHCTAMPNDIDARQWPSGCYSVLVKYDNEVVRSKVVVE